MTNNTLPEIFETFGDQRKKGFLEMKELKDQGKKVVGTFCTYTPTEIFMAAGAIPVGLCSTNEETIPEAEAVLPRNLCPLIKASYGFAATQKCPYMYFSDLVVGETTCDGKKKMYELLGEIKNVHVMNLPHRQDTEMAKKMWLEEVRILKEVVEREFNVTITEEDIRKAIKDKNEERRLLKELYGLSALCPPPMTGMEQIQVLFGVQFKFDHEKKLESLRTTIDKIKEEYESGVRKVSEKSKRILITGCPIGGMMNKVVPLIEEGGGVVVAYENCTGAKSVEDLVDEDEARDPYEVIAEKYLNIGCSVMTPDTRRYDLLRKLCDRFKADGVIEVNLQACHTYNIETESIRRLMDSMGMPFISLETDYSNSDVAQLKTRISAFIEML
ncbi:double-cubane-cluster-containing anaerobic reductase [Anaeropeptidivorans aminofermentans]|uniref:double-cubane-cluster-containing anaerobic reductase n=1 Tax=Anaeropeptidivorans aminofermentans TaxID=2934315 RepID=UPI002B202238|nr:double-cubane-cluster-containing anaerobic reductase [Anaeropeptidivorans aminofermentans]